MLGSRSSLNTGRPASVPTFNRRCARVSRRIQQKAAGLARV
jgi:hypothetical protein